MSVMYKTVEDEVMDFFSSPFRSSSFGTSRRWGGKMWSAKNKILGGLINYSWFLGDLVFVMGDLPTKETDNVVHVTRRLKGEYQHGLFSFKPAPDKPGLSPGAIIYGFSSSWEKIISSGPRVQISSFHPVHIMFVVETCENRKMSGLIKSDCPELCGRFEVKIE